MLSVSRKVFWLSTCIEMGVRLRFAKKMRMKSYSNECCSMFAIFL